MGSVIIALLTCITLILFVLFKPTLKKFNIQTFWIVALIGASILLIGGFLPFDLLISSLKENSSVNPLKILVLFISMSYLSIVLDCLGFFKMLANKVLNKFNKNQYYLFFSMYILISLLTVFTSNDIVILTFTPFIIYFSKRANINPIPYLIMEFITANTYSMCLMIGNPTNVYLSLAFNITFTEYFKEMILPTLFSGISTLVLLLLVFRRDLKKEINVIDKSEVKLDNKILTIISFIILISATILLAISNYINLEMWIICLSCFILLSLILLIYSIKNKSFKLLFNTYHRLPFNLIIFVLSMFTICLSLKYNGITNELYNFFNIFSINKFFTSLTYGLSSTIFCNLINNIPMSILFSNIVLDKTALYSTIIGSNLGAYLTPIGALAGIMWMSILKRNDVKLSFKTFMKYGIIFVPVALIFALLGLMI